MLTFLFFSFSTLQAMFASYIPEIADLIGSRQKYGGEYKGEHGKKSDTMLVNMPVCYFEKIIICANVQQINIGIFIRKKK